MKRTVGLSLAVLSLAGLGLMAAPSQDLHSHVKGVYRWIGRNLQIDKTVGAANIALAAD